MQIQPNFTANYKYCKTDEERKFTVLKNYYKSAFALSCACGTYGILETINKKSIAKNVSAITPDDFKILAKKGLKRNILIGLGAYIAGHIISTPICNLVEPQQIKLNKWIDKKLNLKQKDEKDDKYNAMKSFYKGAQSISTGLLTFGLLETINKFSIAKNKDMKTVEELAVFAQKGVKRNLMFGLAAGVIGYLIAWTSFKLFEPMQTKLQAWADKQNRIAEKAEELVKQEDAVKK